MIAIQLALHLHRVVVLVSVVAQCIAATTCVAETNSLPRAHAHNDYRHDRPLLDALDNGFCSVEADIYLIDGRLLVAHDRIDVRQERTLEKLYLDPLKQRVEERAGWVHEPGQSVLLLIDIKSNGPQTYQVLRNTLSTYPELFQKRQGDQHPPVRVVISGNRPIEEIANDTTRIAGIDGRLNELEEGRSPDLMPLVSGNWRDSFAWRGEGELPPQQRQKLRQLVADVHQRGYLLRFWAVPDQPKAWNELYEAGVDLINTDDLPGLRKFLLTKRNPR